MKAILFIGHGSRLAEGNEEIRTFIQQMEPSIDNSYIVETCFLEFEAPNIPTGIAACVAKGATEIYAIPIIYYKLDTRKSIFLGRLMRRASGIQMCNSHMDAQLEFMSKCLIY